MTNRRDFLRFSALAPLACVPVPATERLSWPVETGQETKQVNNLREACVAGLKQRYRKDVNRLSRGQLSIDVFERLDEELAVIESANATKTFLRLHDIAKFVDSKVGFLRARGVAVGSLVNYALGVSSVCPIKYGLIYEPFLSGQGDSTGSTLMYASSGGGVPNTMAAEVLEFLAQNYNYRRQGNAHAVSDAACSSTARLSLITLWELAVLARTADLVRQAKGDIVDVDELPLNDEPTWRLLANGDTDHVFGVNGEESKELLRKIRPKCVRSLMACITLHPAKAFPKAVIFLDVYLEQTSRRWQENMHPIWIPILRRTHGVLLYREQAMEFLCRAGGIPLSASCDALKVSSRRNVRAMAQFRELFIAGARLRNIARLEAEVMFEKATQDESLRFESHTAAEALLIYQMAYLKANYPQEFAVAIDEEHQNWRNA